ncbi:hypothetical protein A2673_03205 [Candidatus Kaiserbacteria bacterium RIFCSPHIGHO2_01_FULL_50_13]|uniref:DOD-type homing endonuclease domain-containing protein n=1 Tax=Candidatus Kaiserbacteria bacterium RIFCSPLOWO2_01_FULL_50_24 TaxID=1798507 RepID=A0A1F6EIP3_9BACT|nr:MAG: hypothetical protein A2673_03205 [Candidatus Kaiserbacteria bacterium RIFCSPHIGHO2_01_FULL_50_13]OGG73513.1 MAG: hypothetical protein A3A34_01045 [Candidatus Kaiserbacteria bacterium RIFCSPLOWO2_01_FULL_50_24]OGG81562.1 MAG: hypothetical protein A3H74_00580 [Candidatus Kaiserbacteria bacterium RIFCSPLOWO2_02_FULL_51_13]
MKRKSNIDLIWSPEFAYVIGIIASDGNLSPSGRHINITSKDREMVETVKSILRLMNKIGRKARGYSKDKKYFVLQFGDINFYEFLLSIGLTPKKSKTIGAVAVPDKFFRDFLRGCFDGDGSLGTFRHPESKHPQVRLRITSASPAFLIWLLKSAQRLFVIEGGYIYSPKNKSVQILSFGKADSIKILHLMYYKKSVPALSRKRKIATGLLVGE